MSTKRLNKSIFSCIANPNAWKKPGVFGGGEILTKNYFLSLNEFKFYVIQNQHKIIEKEDHIHINLITLPFTKTNNEIQDILNTVIWIIGCLYYFIKNKKHCIFFYACTSNITDFLPCFIASKLLKKKLIVKCHITIYKGEGNSFRNVFNNFMSEGNSHINSIIRAFATYFVLILLSHTDEIICTSDKVRDSLKDKIPNKKLTLNYNGISIDEIKKFRTKEKSYDICFMSRIEKYKGVFEFIEMCKYLDKIHKLNKAVIIGEGTELIKLEQTILQNNLNHKIVITGYLENERFNYLAKSKFLIFPSHAMEGFALVIIEALACNTSIIALENDGFPNDFKNLKGLYLVKDMKEIQQIYMKNQSSIKSIPLEQLQAFDFNRSIRREKEIINNYI